VTLEVDSQARLLASPIDYRGKDDLHGFARRPGRSPWLPPRSGPWRGGEIVDVAPSAPGPARLVRGRGARDVPRSPMGTSREVHPLETSTAGRVRRADGAEPSVVDALAWTAGLATAAGPDESATAPEAKSRVATRPPEPWIRKGPLRSA